MGQVGLADTLSALRAELGRAQDEGMDQQIRFEVTEAEVELLVEVNKEGGAHAGVAIGVLTAGAGGSLSQANSHRVRLKLAVTDAATGKRNLEVHGTGSGSWGDDGPEAAG